MATSTSVTLYGRTKIETAYDVVDSTNVVKIVKDAINDHDQNVTQIDELLNYYKGKQAIRNRTKEYRDDILNVITENRAKEIVDFKVGYLCRGPVKYISRGAESMELINKLNAYMKSEGKSTQDKKLLTWMMIAGTGYRMVLPDGAFDEETGLKTAADEAPFELYTLDPRKAFVVYSSGITERPMAAVYRVVDNDKVTHYTVYTETEVFKFTSDDNSATSEVNGIGFIPIIEYPANESRLGAFEAVVPLLDALNDLNSNRIDGIEQFIQNLIVATNCEFGEEDTQTKIMQAGIINLRSVEGMEQKLTMLNQELNQSQTQVLKDDIEQSIKEICHMPNRNGGSSTSDTGVAVVYRDGWSDAETDAVGVETLFIESETDLLKVVLSICSDLNALQLEPSRIGVRFTRRNYENIDTKVNVLISMLGCEKIDPRYAYAYCNIFDDPEQACAEGLAYYESLEKEVDPNKPKDEVEE